MIKVSLLCKKNYGYDIILCLVADQLKSNNRDIGIQPIKNLSTDSSTINYFKKCVLSEIVMQNEENWRVFGFKNIV